MTGKASFSTTGVPKPPCLLWLGFRVVEPPESAAESVVSSLKLGLYNPHCPPYWLHRPFAHTVIALVGLSLGVQLPNHFLCDQLLVSLIADTAARTVYGRLHCLNCLYPQQPVPCIAGSAARTVYCRLPLPKTFYCGLSCPYPSSRLRCSVGTCG